MVGPTSTHNKSESTQGDSVRPQEQGCTSSGGCEACSALSFLFPAHEQTGACEVKWSPQRGLLLLRRERPREVMPLRYHPGAAKQERTLSCCVWPLYSAVSVLNSSVDGLLYAAPFTPAASPELPARTSWRSAAWLCYLAVVQVDTCLLHGMWQPCTMLTALFFSFNVTWAGGITNSCMANFTLLVWT